MGVRNLQCSTLFGGFADRTPHTAFPPAGRCLSQHGVRSGFSFRFELAPIAVDSGLAASFALSSFFRILDRSAIDCKIRNLSDQGCGLDVQTPLKAADAALYEAKLRYEECRATARLRTFSAKNRLQFRPVCHRLQDLQSVGSGCGLDVQTPLKAPRALYEPSYAAAPVPVAKRPQPVRRCEGRDRRRQAGGGVIAARSASFPSSWRVRPCRR